MSAVATTALNAANLLTYEYTEQTLPQFGGTHKGQGGLHVQPKA